MDFHWEKNGSLQFSLEPRAIQLMYTNVTVVTQAMCTWGKKLAAGRPLMTVERRVTTVATAMRNYSRPVWSPWELENDKNDMDTEPYDTI